MVAGLGVALGYLLGGVLTALVLAITAIQSRRPRQNVG
jgi:hypothetical protein